MFLVSCLLLQLLTVFLLRFLPELFLEFLEVCQSLFPDFSQDTIAPKVHARMSRCCFRNFWSTSGILTSCSYGLCRSFSRDCFQIIVRVYLGVFCQISLVVPLEISLKVIRSSSRNRSYISTQEYYLMFFWDVPVVFLGISSEGPLVFSPIVEIPREIPLGFLPTFIREFLTRILVRCPRRNYETSREQHQKESAKISFGKYSERNV